MHLLLFEGTKWINQSITSGGSLSGFRGRTGSMNYVEELNALNHKGVFDKMHQSNWRKENLGDDFS
jgi:hypothetical protein